MMINRIQTQIFNKLSKESNLDVDSYIKENSLEFLSTQKDLLEDLTEQEGDSWIHKAYLKSLG